MMPPCMFKDRTPEAPHFRGSVLAIRHWNSRANPDADGRFRRRCLFVSMGFEGLLVGRIYLVALLMSIKSVALAATRYSTKSIKKVRFL